MMNNYSFDIFDTLISRKFANDKGIFVALRDKLKDETEHKFPDYFIDEFVNLRLRAQATAHNTSSYPEVTLNEIYAALGAEFPQIGTGHLELLQKLEETIEIQNCYPIPENISRIAKLVDSGHNVYLISDMYLGRETVVKMLGKADPRLCSLPLFLSSDLKMRKSDGTLFSHVCKTQKIEPSSLIHTGDNFSSDCVMAKRKGIKYDFYQDSQLSKVERSYFREEQNLFLQLFAGASKQTRLEGYNLKPSYHLGASFMAPLFYGFVHDALKKAVGEGIKKLYFLARDGYLLKIIAEEITACFHYDIEIRYLYTSRQATYFASLFCLTSSCFEWVFQEMSNVITLNVVAKRLHFESQQFLDHLNDDLRQSLFDHGLDNRLSGELRHRLQDELLNNNILKTEIESKAKVYRETALCYFKQEGLFEDERIGFVDIGWRGTLQDAIFKVLKSKKSDIKLTTYYFAVTYFSANTTLENRKVPAYMFPTTKAGKGPVLELLLQCEHGTTLGYQREDSGRSKPVLKTTASQLGDWGLDHYIRGIRTFARTLSESLVSYPEIETTYAAISPILTETLENPIPEIAATLGDLHYSGNIEESNIRIFAPPFTVSQALSYMVANQAKRSSYTQWFDGSYSRSSLLPKVIIRLDPRLNFENLVKNYTSREKLGNHKRLAKRFIQLHLGSILK